MKRTAMQHTKMRRLMRILQVPQYAAVGILESLWHLTAREAPTGNIGKLSNEDIAAWIDWMDDADRLVSALTVAGWLDEDESERLRVHDWHEHADEATKKAISRQKPDMSRHVQTCLDKKCLPLPEPCQSLALPEPLPKKVSEAKASSPRPVSGSEEQAGLIYEQYPRKEGRRAALRAIALATKRVEGGEIPGHPTPVDARRLLFTKTRAYARSPAGKNHDPTKIPHPATWFNQSRYLDDEAQWQHVAGDSHGSIHSRSASNLAEFRRTDDALGEAADVFGGG